MFAPAWALDARFDGPVWPLYPRSQKLHKDGSELHIKMGWLFTCPL